MPLAPGGGTRCQLCGWLIRPDNDACTSLPPRTRMAAALDGGKRWRVDSLRGEEVEIKDTGASETVRDAGDEEKWEDK